MPWIVPARDREVELVVGVDGAEALVDADQLDGGRRGRHRPAVHAGHRYMAGRSPRPAGRVQCRSITGQVVVRHVVVDLDLAGDDLGLGLVDRGLHLRR